MTVRAPFCTIQYVKIRFSSLLIILLSAVFALLFILQDIKGISLPVFRNLENNLLDLKFKVRGSQPVWPDQVIIGIDERSLARLGRHPWPRSVYKDLFLRLAEYKPKAVGMDLTFADPDKTAEQAYSLFQKLEEKYYQFYARGDNPEYENFASSMSSELQIDRFLAEAISKVPNLVGGFYNIYDPEEAKKVKVGEGDLYRILDTSEIKGVLFQEVQEATLPHTEALRTSIPIIAAAVPKQGFVELIADRDGAIRRTLLVIQRNLHFYPSIAFQLASVVKGEDISLEFDRRGVKNLKLGNQGIPVDRFGLININFLKRNPTYPILSFYDVAYGDIDKKLIENKVVWVGVTSPVITKETFKTPYSSFTPGVQIHANIADNIVNKTYLAPVKNSWVYELILIFVLGGLMLFTLTRLNPLWAMLSTLIMMAASFPGDTFFLFSKNLLFQETIPLVQLASTYLIVTAYRFFIEERESRFVRHAFRHYVSPAVVDKIMESPERLALGGDKKVLTVLFSDIRNFTPLSEKLPPKELTRFINDYMSEMTQAVFKHQGLLDKYMGDALMAIFGAPVDDPEHPIHACEAALDMIHKLPLIRERWPVDTINCGVGVHTGEMIVGNMGSQEVFDYTVVGDNVNLGARLEKSNKVYGTNIILSEETYNLVKGKAFCRELDLIRVRGKEKPSRIFELLSIGHGEEKEKELAERFNDGLNKYRQRKWDDAILAFNLCLKIKPDDNPSKLFIQRAEAFRKSPPEDAWQGIYKAG